MTLVATGTASPLVTVERAVQARAKDLNIDMAAPGAADQLRTLIAEEITAWHHDYQRGRRNYDIADPDTAAERAWRNLAGYGPLQPLLDDPDVWEIMVNAPASIFCKRHSGRNGYHDEVFHDDDHVLRVLTKMLDDASRSHRKLDPAEGLQDAQLDTGARLHIVHSDIGRDGHILVNIRKFTGVAYTQLQELVDNDMLDHATSQLLRACVRSRLSVLVAGPPGSGKTTLLACLAAELPPDLRVVIAEEVFETDIPLPNVAHMQTRPARADRREVDLRRLVSGFLRMAPDVAVVGEVRDREALPLLLTLSSGVQGFTTIHAGSARQALSRLRFICQLADTGSELTISALSALVTDAIDVVVYCRRAGRRVRVTEILAVEDLQVAAGGVAFTTTPLYLRAGHDDPLSWTGNIPVRAARAFEMAGFDIRSLLGGTLDMLGLLAAGLAGFGAYLLYTALVLGQRRLFRPHRGGTRRSVPWRAWLTEAGLGDVGGRQFAAASGLCFLLGGSVALLIFGGVLTALVAATLCASLPAASFRARRRRRRAVAHESWPRMLEELRLLTGSLGRSIPQALFEVGRRAPAELRGPFQAAEREWLLTTDFETTAAVLRHQLADPAADAVIETLVIAHEVGGADLDRRLAALIDDRVLDLEGRKDAATKQAGVRFARRFVLLVPLGMAVAGLAIGTGRAAYETPGGQVAVVVGIVAVVACWLWSGRLMQLPEEPRVFAGDRSPRPAGSRRVRRPSDQRAPGPIPRTWGTE